MTKPTTIIYLVVLLGLISRIYAGQFITFSYDNRNNKLYIPTGYVNGVASPLYVMLHGCTQDPTTFATGTKMNTYGEQYNLLVLYPEQTSSGNMNKCWNWFEPSDQERGSGEPAMLAGMVKAVAAKYTVDSARVYVAGLSAGAAMSVIMGATYPDIFAAVAVGAGLEYKAATSTVTAYSAMSSGGPNPTTQGDIAYQEEGSQARPLGVLVIQGTSDYTVNKVNGDQVLSQWARTNDRAVGNGQANGYVTNTPDRTQDGQVSGGYTYQIRYYDNKLNGENLMQYVVVNGMGHAWSGGSNQGSYTDPKGPDASLIMIQFFSTFPYNNQTTTSSSTTGPATTGSSTTGSATTGPATTGTGTSTTGSTTTSSTTGPVNVITFNAIASETGYVGQYEADGYGTDQTKLGDKGMFNVNTYKAILSFDASGLSNATISQAFLSICRQSLSGSVSSIQVDIKAGSFSGTNQLTQGDYNAAATASNAMDIDVPSADGQCVKQLIPAGYYQFIENQVSDRIQFRLSGTTTASFTANTLFLDNQSNVPQLHVILA